MTYTVSGGALNSAQPTISLELDGGNISHQFCISCTDTLYAETCQLQTGMLCLLVVVQQGTSVLGRQHTLGLGRSRRRLHSSADRSSAVPRTHNTFDDRSFAAAGPRVWNSLPAHLRDEDITYNCFRRELKKTYWFSCCFQGAMRLPA